ncbi:WD40/YVTN repeat-like-containing domain superfamily [Sesbania bispinosa]|nr:WD40/YVTN repeat-like-containing domain superfamily [Sesbania bispinosa]
MALRWFCTRSLLRESLDYSLIDKIPGRPNDRKTLLGELNWIFTAVTDTIAWNVLPHDLFQRLFRQDLLVASLFRNFYLLSECDQQIVSPVSHPMDAWDMAAELCSLNFPHYLTFFTEQLTAFEVWLDHGSEHKKPPEQLPIVLQGLHCKLFDMAIIMLSLFCIGSVLLSQCHRFRALVLLGRFLDMGPWAVDLALSVGIFPYVLKLLQTTTPELRQILVFIWTKILALDKSCQVDLVKDGGHIYFIKFLDSMEAYPEQRAMAAFVLAVIVDGHRRGQEACIEAGLIHVCLKHLQSSSPNDSQTEPLFLQWLCLCLGKLWEDFTEAQTIGLQEDATSIYVPLLSEPQPEVRASAVFALGTLLNVGFDSCRSVGGDEECDDDDKFRAEVSIVKSLLSVASDGSPLVRAEVAVALARFAFGHNKHLKSIAAAYWKPQTNSLINSLPSLTNIKDLDGGYPNQNQLKPHGSIVSPQIGPLRVGNDNTTVFEMGGTPPVSPPRPSYITGMRRVCSLEFRPHLMTTPDSGLADPLLGSAGASGTSDRSFLPQSTIYNWSCGHFSKPLLTAADDSEEVLARREEREKFALEHIAKCQHSAVSRLTNPIAKWDTKGTQTVLLQPFSPIVIAADENERIRIWNHEEATLLNSFDNHDFPDKGISKLCLVNELDDSLLLAASSDGNIRIWKDYTLKGKQKLVTAFSSIHGHKPGVRNLNAVVDWQQQCGYLYASGEISSVMLWDLDKEQLVNSTFIIRLQCLSIGSSVDYDHTHKSRKVVGIGFQPGLDPGKCFSAGDIQFLDIRNHSSAYLTIEAHRGSLTALAVHRHAPIIASGSAKQLIKVFSLEGDQLGTIRYYPTLMAQKIGSVSCLSFHPYQLLLAAGAADACVCIYADDNSQAR